MIKKNDSNGLWFMTVPSFAFVTLFSNPFLSRHKQITYTALFNKVFVLKEFYKKIGSYHMV